MSKKSIFLPIIMLFIGGCSDPTIDTSTDESMKASIEEIRQSLTQEKQDKLNDALSILVFDQVSLKDLFVDGVSGVSSIKEKMKEKLNGKSGEEIIVEAERVKIERKEKEKSQALIEIKELQDEQEKATKATEELKQFKVVRSRFYKRKKKYYGNQRIIELTVKNETSHPISRAYFKAILKSIDRSVPWLVDTFNYKISGGIEPGEEAEWSLAPNSFGDWGTVDAPTDAILIVEVERLDGPDGEPLFSSRGFSEDDAKRLKKLKELVGQDTNSNHTPTDKLTPSADF